MAESRQAGITPVLKSILDRRHDEQAQHQVGIDLLDPGNYAAGEQHQHVQLEGSQVQLQQWQNALLRV